MIDICCPKCGRIHHVGDEHAGFLMLCSGCGEVVPIVPMRGQPARPPSWVSERQTGSADPRVTVRPVTRWYRIGRIFSLVMHPRVSKPAWALVIFAVAMAIIVVIPIMNSSKQPSYNQATQDQPAGQTGTVPTGTTSPGVLEPGATPENSLDSQQVKIQSATDQGRTFKIPVENPDRSDMQTPTSTPSVVPSRPPESPNAKHLRKLPDIGVDLALPVHSGVSLMDEPNAGASLVRTITEKDVLVLVERKPSEGWFDVIDVRSGKEGWVNQDDVQIRLTNHPERAARFAEKYSGSDDPPDVSVENATSGKLNLKIGSDLYTVRPNASLKIPLNEGTYSYYATEPGVIPAMGRQQFQRGHEYSWRFWIETSYLRSP